MHTKNLGLNSFLSYQRRSNLHVNAGGYGGRSAVVAIGIVKPDFHQVERLQLARCLIDSQHRVHQLGGDVLVF
jgi:hypothetical protein